MVIGDASQLHRVLSNIVVNGLKHGGPDAAVDVNVRKDGDTIVVAISDDGVGMSPEVTSHIFERFYRADESRSRESGGSGLGLAITKRWLRLMVGRSVWIVWKGKDRRLGLR